MSSLHLQLIRVGLAGFFFCSLVGKIRVPALATLAELYLLPVVRLVAKVR